MPIKPVHRTTYVLSIIVGGYSLAVHSLTALIISIILSFYAFMSCDIIDDRKRP